MTGEMGRINQDGEDDSGSIWSTHAAITKALRADGLDATLQPFDQYQGPYILVGKDVRVGNKPYQLTVQHAGVIRLWIISDDLYGDDMSVIYREDTEVTSDFFCYDDIEYAIACAKQLLTQKEAT